LGKEFKKNLGGGGEKNQKYGIIYTPAFFVILMFCKGV